MGEGFNHYESDTNSLVQSECYVHPTFQKPKMVLPTFEIEFRQPFRLQLHCESTVDYRQLIVRVHFTTTSGEAAAGSSLATTINSMNVKREDR